MNELFRLFSTKVSEITGSSWAFITAFSIIVIWSLTGPIFQFSDTWQLIINTGTTIITFLMVFLIQNTQNRDARAMQIKLDELLRAQTNARTGLVDIEEMPDEDLKELQNQFKELHSHYRSQLNKRSHKKR